MDGWCTCQVGWAHIDMLGGTQLDALCLMQHGHAWCAWLPLLCAMLLLRMALVF